MIASVSYSIEGKNMQEIIKVLKELYFETSLFPISIEVEDKTYNSSEIENLFNKNDCSLTMNG
jgi:hypothetical protein